MFTRSLFNIQRFFASQFKVSKEGFLLPLPPKRPPNSRNILLGILKEKDIKNPKSSLQDEKFAIQERQQAEEKAKNLKKEYDDKLSEYEKQYGFPKRPLNQYMIFVNQSIKDKQVKMGVEGMKALGESFKQLTEEQKQQLQVEADKEREKFSQQKQEYESRLSKLKLPDLKRSNQYNLFVEDISKEKKINLKEIALLWKDVPQAKKDEYAAKAAQLNQETEERLNQFVNENKLNEEDKQVIVKGYLDKEETKELVEKTVKKEKEVVQKEKNKIKREKKVEQNKQKKEKIREKKAEKREKISLKRKEEKEKSASKSTKVKAKKADKKPKKESVKKSS